MARSYGKILNTLWTSRKWRGLKGKDRPRLLYFFFHSCPQRNSIGCFHCGIGYIAADLGWGETQVSEAIEKLNEAGLVNWNHDEEIVRIVNFIPLDPPTNLKHAESMLSAAMALPDCMEKARVLGDLLQSEHGTAIQGLSEMHERLLEAFPYPIDIPKPLPLPKPKTSSLRSEVGAQARTRLPDDWPSQHDQELAKTYWTSHGRPDICDRLADEIAKARAHHRGKGTRSADWPQSWVTWYSRALEYSRAPRGPANNQIPPVKILKVVGDQ